MQHIQRRTVSVQGMDLAYAEAGDGPAVVYIHGAMTTLDEGMIGLAPTLAPRFRFIAFDRPGHGASGRDLVTGSPWRQAQLIRGAVEALGIERPVVVGHSFGGAVALAYALQFPDEVAGVVAVAPIAFPEARMESLLFGLRTIPGAGDWLSMMAIPADRVLLPLLWNAMFLPQSMTPTFAAEFPFGLAARRGGLRADGEEAVLLMDSLTRSAAAYADCRVPVHVLQGERDIVVNRHMHGKPLAALLPDAIYTELEGMGHMLHHFRPEAVALAIDGLIARADAALPIAA